MVGAGRVGWDMGVAGGLALLTWGITAGAVAGFDTPFEDAAMLLRYADHLASGHGIRWNPGEAPVDGATDFLYMVTVAALRWLGAPLVAAGKGLSLACHVATVPVIYLVNRRVLGVSSVLSALAALVFAIGPGIALIAAHFGTPMFALGVAIAWGVALQIRKIGLTVGSALAFSAAALFFSLVRPEGVLLSLLILAPLAADLEATQRRTLIIVFAAVFGLLGGAYFLWRWGYFGHPFPNPFYKKGGGRLYSASLLHSFENVLKTGGIFLLFHVVALFHPRLQRDARFALIPILGFSSVWLFLSDEMNFVGRFQYAVLPLILMSFAPLAAHLAESAGLTWPDRGPRKLLLGSGLVAGLCLGAVVMRRAFPPQYASYDGLREVGRVLAPLRDRGYTLAVTEAGLLPLYSGWRTIDLWGLNDAEIAHAGGLTEEYLRANAPDVVLYHSFSSPIQPEQGRETLRGWNRMVSLLEKYVKENDYVLAAAYGSGTSESHWYFVRRGIEHEAAIVKAIRAVRYDWLGQCVNWAALGLPPAREEPFTFETSLRMSGP